MKTNTRYLGSSCYACDAIGLKKIRIGKNKWLVFGVVVDNDGYTSDEVDESFYKQESLRLDGVREAQSIAYNQGYEDAMRDTRYD